MKQRRYKKKYYGRGLVRPTLNQGNIFVGEGLRKKRYKKRKRAFYGKGIFGPLLLGIPKLLDKIL